MDRPLANSDTPTSEDDHSHKSLKSIKTLKSLKPPPASRALNARCAGSAKTDCNLCYGTGQFLDSDGYVVILTNDEDDDEYEVECEHSMAGNLAEIRRIEYESENFGRLLERDTPKLTHNISKMKTPAINSPSENWRPIAGWEGHYEVSDRGRVRSLDRTIIRSDGRPYRARGRVLRPQRHPPSWVVTVTLARRGHFQHRCVHKLVQEAFGEKEKAA